MGHKSYEELFGFKEICFMQKKNYLVLKRIVLCRNAICILRVLSKRCIEMQKDLYVCFIDYEKAFDNVHHNEVLYCLEEAGFDRKDLTALAEIDTET